MISQQEQMGDNYKTLEQMIKDHHWGSINFLAIWYGVIIWAFATGG